MIRVPAVSETIVQSRATKSSVVSGAYTNARSRANNADYYFFLGRIHERYLLALTGPLVIGRRGVLQFGRAAL